jgi:hypothetical protein
MHNFDHKINNKYQNTYMSRNILRLKIDDHYRELIGEIDLKAEELIYSSPLLRQEIIDKINAKRERFIKEIDLLRKLNMHELEEKFDQNEAVVTPNFEQHLIKSCFLLNISNSFNYKNYNPVDNCSIIIDLIDCIDEAFGYLIICDQCISKQRIEILKSLISCSNEAEKLLFNLKV